MTDIQNFGICSLCGRRSKRGTTEHHLIPRRCHANKWFKKRFSRQQLQATIPMCPDCHSAVHRIVPRHKELGRHFNTREKLLKHDGILAFVAWVRGRR